MRNKSIIIIPTLFESLVFSYKDFIRLKIMNITVYKDAVTELLKRFDTIINE